MGLSIAQLPPLTSHNENSFFNTAAATDFKVFASAKPQLAPDAFIVSSTKHIVAKADSIDYFLADVMPTGALLYRSI